ncbi:MAG: hypothetical protein K2X82_23200 [Gemmataceae bacterium]|nr:hypothetical protein [Gemmataceae bacterium]
MICPDANQAPATVECKGYLPKDTECSNEALGICSNETWEVKCVADGTKKCKDVQVPPKEGEILPSVCYVTCECK